MAFSTARRSSGPSTMALGPLRMDAFLPWEMSREPGRAGGLGGMTTEGMWIQDVVIDESASDAADKAALRRISELLCSWSAISQASTG